ncbi:MAG: hypothetical protein K0S33_128 [Bacteroidetes bacterium]|jgi:hypothetical protein|nr:hypothetical protein [Bacteroidota bacterium]
MQQLSETELEELKKAYVRNKSFIWKSAFVLMAVEIIAQVIKLFKGQRAFANFDLLYFLLFVWIGIALYLYFILLKNIQKDMDEQGKLTFRTRVLRKGKSDLLDVNTWGIRMEKNPYGIKFVKLSEEAYLSIEPLTEIELSVSRRSHVYLSHTSL